MKKVSIILACYNDELSIRESSKRIIKILDATKYQYELIFIDDCSLDKSRQEIKKIKNLYPKKDINIIFHEKNLGRGGTVREGIVNAKGAIVGFIDIDLEVSENYLPAFILAINSGADVVIATRMYKFHFSTIHRYIGSVVYPYLVRKILKLEVKDTEAGYKFFNRKKILPVIKQTINNGWFWDTEIVARSFYSNLKLIELPVLFVRRVEKKSTVNFFRDSIIQFTQLIKFRKNNRRYIK